eukprot:69182_1
MAEADQVERDYNDREDDEKNGGNAFYDFIDNWKFPICVAVLGCAAFAGGYYIHLQNKKLNNRCTSLENVNDILQKKIRSSKSANNDLKNVNNDLMNQLNKLMNDTNRANKLLRQSESLMKKLKNNSIDLSSIKSISINNVTTKYMYGFTQDMVKKILTFIKDADHATEVRNWCKKEFGGKWQVFVTHVDHDRGIWYDEYLMRVVWKGIHIFIWRTGAPGWFF